jgi:hypothetical protein
MQKFPAVVFKKGMENLNELKVFFPGFKTQSHIIILKKKRTNQKLIRPL